MTIAVGDRVPDVKVFTFGDNGPEATTSAAVLGHGKVVLFGVPGAFTPTCSDHHLPGFVLRADELRAKGVDKVVCVSVNDPFVMGAWGKDQNVGDSVVMLADGNGELAEAMGLTMDGSGFGLGHALAALRRHPRGRRRHLAGRRARPRAEASARPKRCSRRSEPRRRPAAHADERRRGSCTVRPFGRFVLPLCRRTSLRRPNCPGMVCAGSVKILGHRRITTAAAPEGEEHHADAAPGVRAPRAAAGSSPP